MAKYTLIDIKTFNQSDIELSDVVFGAPWHQQIIFDVVNAQRAAMRQGNADVKNRWEIRGGGRKPWRQKGTGRARHGSIRSPLWRGGGVIFGPTPRSYNVKLNKKIKQHAFRVALSHHLNNNSLVLVNELSIDVPKTKVCNELLTKLNCDKKVLIVDVNINDNVQVAARNLPNVLVIPANHVSVYDILNAHSLILSADAVKYFEEGLNND